MNSSLSQKKKQTQKTSPTQIATTICGAMLGFFSLYNSVALSIQFLGIYLSVYRLLLAFSTLFFFINYKGVKKSISDKSYGLVIIVVITSLFQISFAFNKALLFKYLFLVLSYFYVYLFYKYAVRRSHLLVVGIAILLSTLFVSSLLVYEIITGHYLFSFNENVQYFIGNNLTSYFGLHLPLLFFGNPNDSSFFCFTTALLAYAMFSKLYERFIFKVIFSGIFLELLFIIVFSLSRAALIAFALFFFINGIFKFSHYDKAKVKLLIPVLIVMMSVFLFTIVFFSFGASDSERLKILDESIWLFLEKTYGFGVGLGQIYFFSAAYGTGIVISVHSFVVELLISFGFIPFLFICYFVISKLSYIYRIECNLFCVLFSFLLSFGVATLGPGSIMQCDYVSVLVVVSILILGLKNNNHSSALKFSCRSYEQSLLLANWNDEGRIAFSRGACKTWPLCH